MDGNTIVYDSITATNESEVISQETKAIDDAKIEGSEILENELNFETTQLGDEKSHRDVQVNSNVSNIEDHDLLIENNEHVLINSIETVPIENTNILIDTKESPVVISSEGQETLDTSINYLDGSLNSAIVDNNIVNQDINLLQPIVESNVSTHTDFENVSQSTEKDAEGKDDAMGPNLEHSENVSIQEKASTVKEIIQSENDTNSEEKIEFKVDDSLQNKPDIREEQTLEFPMDTVEDLESSNLITNTKENYGNSKEPNNACSQKTLEEEGIITNEDIELNTNKNEKEAMINSDQLVQNTISQNDKISDIDPKILEPTETIEEQVQSIHDPKLQDQSAKKILDQEIADITQETIGEPKDIVHDIGQNTSGQDNIETTAVTEHVNINNDNQIISKSVVVDSDNIEKQMSSIVQDELQEVNDRTEKTMSIVEAIQRDFDETDSEETDKQDNVDESQPVEVTEDHVVVGVNISDQLQHGTVTVTDTTGQVYYVQSVEDLIVVENDELSATLDQPETLEVTVLSEESVQQQSDSARVRERPPIPSHILGRNIDNPVIDTFRNGKVPPKPRLGVKIPYKNLTSQIVSKDELAKEILDRQKQKYKQSGQTTKEILFAKKLTQRLAKKIVPTATVKSPTATVEKNRQQAINNSDLLAILEGDEDDTKVACTSKSNIGSSIENKKDQNSPIKNEKTINKAVMSKTVEREIALKQLREVSTGFSNRRKCPGPKLSLKRGKSEPEVQLTVVESEFSVEESTAVPVKQEGKKDMEKVVRSKLNDNIEVLVAKSDEPKPNTIKKKSEPEKFKPSETKDVMVTQSESVEAKQVEARVEKVEKAATDTVVKSKTVDMEEKKNELKQPILSEPVKLEKEQSNQKVKPDDIIETTKSQSINVQAKAASILVVTSAKSTTTTVNTKIDEVNSVVSQKVDDIPKKIDATTKPIVIKVTDSNKISGKVDPLLTDGKDEYVERKQISNPPVKTYTRKRKSTEDPSILSNVPDKKPIITQKDINIPPNTYITKSSRVIKRKVIWDPDEPSTARSLTRFAKPDLQKSEKQLKLEVSPNKTEKKTVVKSVVKIETIKSPSKSPDSLKTKKRLSEIDKLLMDEGAVNMLYAFKNIDDTIRKKKTAVISLDKAQRELMNKTNELKKDLKTNSDKISPKSLRRKDSPIPSPSKKAIPASVSRKKSKDSNRSSLHSPPASPGMAFLNHAEASRIIRRHSSSSYSSMEGDFDAGKKGETEAQTLIPVDLEKISKKRIASSSAENNKIKKAKRNTDKENVTIDTEKSKANEEKPKHFSKLVESETSRAFKYNKYKTFSVKEMDHMVQIILLPSFNNEAYLTPEILNELCNIIKELQDDVNCTVVLISSSASSFCHGINYKTLLSDKEQSRRTFAKKLAQCVTNFLRILATFTKILVAGIHGDTVGLGVTILPLFDMVIASDTATFSIPNARLGCAAEGGSLLALPHLMHNVLVSELLYASRKLIAAEALRLGMVTRVLWPDKFQQELVAIVKGISLHSPQFMELTKKQLRQRMVSHIESVLDTEVDTLVQHWTSSECQKNFAVYG